MRHGLAAHTTAARAHSLCSAAANAVAHASAVSNTSSPSATTTTSSSSSSFASQDSHDAIEQHERQSLQAQPPHASTTHTAVATARATSTSSSLSLASRVACRCCCCSGTCGGNSNTYAASSGHNSSTTSSSSNADNNNTHVVVLTGQQQQQQRSCGGGGCSCCDGVVAAVAAFRCQHHHNTCTSTPSSLLGQPESAMGGTISNGSVATPRSASCADDDSATRRAVAWSSALQEQQQPLSLSSSSHYAVVHTSSSSPQKQQQQQHAAQRARGMSAFDSVDAADDSDARGATADNDEYDDDDEQQRRQQQLLLQHREAQWRAGVVTSAAHSCTTRDDRSSDDVSRHSYKHSSVASNDDEKEAEVGHDDAYDGATHCPVPLHATATTTTRTTKTSPCSYRRAVSPLSVCLSSTSTLCASHGPQYDSAARRGGGNATTLACSTSSNSHGGVVAVCGGDSISGDYSRSCVASSSSGSTTTALAAATTTAATTTTVSSSNNNNNNSSMCSSSGGGSSSRLSRCRQKMRSLTAPAFDLKPIEDAQDCSALLADVCNAARCHPLSKITRYLYLGTWRDASDEALLRAHGITYVLNVAKEVDAGPHTLTWQHDGSHGSGSMTAAHGLHTGTCSAGAAAAATACNGSRTVCATIPMTDCHHQDLTQHFETAFAFIEHARRAGQRVLVHCRRGISRSAAIVIAYLMATHQRSYESALAYVMQRRSCVSLNLAFQEHLSEYQPDVRWAHTHGGRTHTHTHRERGDGEDDDASSCGGSSTNNTTSTARHASQHPRHGHRRCREDGVTSGGDGGGGVSIRSSDACTLHMPHDGGSNGSLCSDMSCNSNCNSSDGDEPTAMRTCEVDDGGGGCGGSSGRCAQRMCGATCASPRHKDATATTPHCGPQQQPQPLSRSYW